MGEIAERIELDVVDVLCSYLSIGVGDLFEYPPGEGDKPRTRFRNAE